MSINAHIDIIDLGNVLKQPPHFFTTPKKNGVRLQRQTPLSSVAALKIEKKNRDFNIEQLIFNCEINHIFLYN